MPKVLKTIAELRAWRRQQHQRVGIIPTMGALHRGHAELMDQVRPQVDQTVLTLFVNPKQFGPTEDFDRYPRAFEQDLALARKHGVDVVFNPDVSEIYPAGYSTYVEETLRSQPLCGTYRPVFFKGVATVVLKLFNIVEPQLAVFGMKDAQQFYVVQKMIQDLHLPIELLGVPTVREPDGLALSSRNAYLSPDERERAPWVYRVLTEARDRIQQGESLTTVLENSKWKLEQHGFQTQYLELREVPSLEPALERVAGKRVLLAVAAFLGATRLIDNIEFELPGLS